MARFEASAFLPTSMLQRITEIRIADPERPWRAAQARKRRPHLAPDGRLNVLAADHPARRVTRVGNDPLAMADRHDYLARVLRVLLGDAVDGVMATMELLEELLILHDLVAEAGGPAFLDGKLLIPSLNRGGLLGVAWELDDPVTGASPSACARWRMDGAKLLWRVCDDEPASLHTMEACARAITELNGLGLPTFLEPLPVQRASKGFEVIKEPGALARLAGVASALGDSSRFLWLKLPYAEGYGTVAGATTLPVLLLGGPAVGDPTPLLAQVGAGLAAGANVRGTLVGRNVLYPGDEDPLGVAQAVHGLVHEGWEIERALKAVEQRRGQALEALTRWLT